MINKRIIAKNIIMVLVVSIIFTFFTVSGIWSRNQMYFSQYKLGILLLLLIYFCIYVILVSGLVLVKNNVLNLKCVDNLNKYWNNTISHQKEKWIVFVGFCLLYFPVFMAYYPGIFGNDGPVEIYQLYGPGQKVTAHHPLAHIYLLKLCFELGKKLCGDYNKGLFLYTLVQLLFIISVFSYTIFWMRRRKIVFLLRLGTFLFLAFNPIIQLMNVNTTKDTIFGGFFLLTILMLLDFIEKQNFNNALKYVLMSFGMCIFRNQGYYILAFVCIGSIILIHRNKVKIASLILGTVIIGWFVMNPLVNWVGIAKGDAREMFSVPMQQIARVWNEDKNGVISLLDEERQLIENLIPVENLQAYHSNNADYVKSGFKTEVLKENVAKYLKLYLSLGKKYTEIYFRVFTELVSGFWDINQYGDYRGLMYLNTYTEEETNICNIKRDSKFLSFALFIEFVVNITNELPVLRVVFSHVLPVWLMFIVLVSSIVEKRNTISVIMLFLLGQWGIMLLSPAMLMRYAYPLIICVPLLCGLFIQPACIQERYE